MSDEKSLGELAHAAWWDFWQDDSARQDWDELDQFEQSAWQDAAVAAFPPGAVAVDAGYLAALERRVLAMQAMYRADITTMAQREYDAVWLEFQESQDALRRRQEWAGMEGGA